MKTLRALFILIILVSCGTPFEEDYWDDEDLASEQEESEGRFIADLQPLSSLSFANGDAVLDFSGNSAFVQLEMEDVPQNVVQAEVLVTDQSCTELAVEPPTTGTLETRNFTYTENGTRASLLPGIAGDDDVVGKSFVVFAYARGSDGTPASSIFPLACGPLIRPQDDRQTTGTSTVVAGGVNVGAVGGVSAGTTGGTLGGTTATGGFTTVGTAGGVAGGVTGGFTTGVTVGTGGVAGGVTGGVTGGFTTGSTLGTGGVAGAVTGGNP